MDINEAAPRTLTHPLSKDGNWMVDYVMLFDRIKKHISARNRNFFKDPYREDFDIFDRKTNEIMTTVEVDKTYKDLGKEINDYYNSRFKNKGNNLISVQGSTRMVVTAKTTEIAEEIYSEVHNSKKKVKVRIMSRKVGYKLWIDVPNKIQQVIELSKIQKILKHHNAYDE